jgi:hypothetical protein
METFTFKNITFVVKRNDKGSVVYKDKAHLGGPWSNAFDTMDNQAIDSKFKRRLRKAADNLTPGE